MATIIFQGGGMSQALAVEATAGDRLIDVVRELVSAGQLPLYWRCGQGTCGACLVYLAHAHSQQALPVVLGGKERNVLARLKLLSEAQRQVACLPDTAALPRLACHVLVPDGELHVSWPV